MRWAEVGGGVWVVCIWASGLEMCWSTTCHGMARGMSCLSLCEWRVIRVGHDGAGLGLMSGIL